MAEASMGENITVNVTGNKVVLTIDKTKKLRESGSGKSTIVATTGGNTVIPGTNIVLGLNAYVKK
jgi:hypothetical protein